MQIMINPEWLRTFETLVITKHFTKTALQLGMTQPGVSQHLNKLELALGTELVDRSKKSFYLRPAGEKLKNYIETLQEGERRFLESLNVDDPYSGACRFSAPGSFGLPLYDFLLEWAVRHPKIRLDLLVAPSFSVEKAVENETVDIGYIYHRPTSELLNSEKVADETLCLVIPKDFPKSIINWNDLTNLGFIWHPDGPKLASRLLKPNFPKEYRNFSRIPIRSSINQINRILDPVACGLGFSILPKLACDRSPARKGVKIAKLEVSISDPIYKITLKRRELPLRFKSLNDGFTKYLKKI